jgi:hypothetical protein
VEGVWRSLQAARGEDVQVEHPVWCGYSPAFHIALASMKMEKKLTNSGPFMESISKHSIYTPMYLLQLP